MVGLRTETKTCNGKKPCKRCGTTLRYAAGHICVACHKGHSKNYYAAHPDKYEGWKARQRKPARAMGEPITGTMQTSEAMDAITTTTTEQRKEKKREAGRRWRLAHPAYKEKQKEASRRYQLAHPERFRENVRRSRRKHRDQINDKQREKYAAKRIAAGRTYTPNGVRFATPRVASMKENRAAVATPIIATMGIVESADAIMFDGGAAIDLRSLYLRKLLERDAKIWDSRMQHITVGMVGDEPDDDKPMSSAQVKEHNHIRTAEPCRKCGTYVRTRHGQCVECMRRGNKAVKEAKAAAAKRAVKIRPGLGGLRQSQVKRIPPARGETADYMRAAGEKVTASSPVQERWSGH